ncbi:MAG TPA: alpha/beta fold hydrolase [Chitinophagaceae bacterium]|nr:alpha/beta fold hydrolase [Chitinophagaceae bacterium]
MEHLILLHGAIGSKQQFASLQTLLSAHYHVHTFNFYGHGGDDFADQPFSIPLFAEQVINYIESIDLQRVHIFGYSMGGYVALYIAKHHPSMVQKIITLGTKFYWDTHIAFKEAQQLQPTIIEQKIPAFAKVLQERHTTHQWSNVLNQTADMLIAMGENNHLHEDDYASITSPVCVMLGDRDKMVTLQETLNVYTKLPNAQMAMLPNTPHIIEQVNMGLLCYMIHHFIDTDKTKKPTLS